MVVSERSFLCFAYPFQHLLNPDQRAAEQLDEEWEERLRTIEGAKCRDDKGKELAIWERDSCQPDEDLLPHLGPVERTLRFWKLTEEAGKRFRLTHPWKLFLFAGGEETPIRLGFAWGGKAEFTVRVGLCRSGVGVLVWAIQPTGQGLGDWLRVLDYVRYTKRRRVRFRCQGPDPKAPEATPPMERTALDKEGRFELEAVNELLLGTLAGGRNHWWREVYAPYQMIPFSALQVDECDVDRRGEMLYRVSQCFRMDREVHVDDAFLRQEPPALAYVQDQWFHANIEGAGFLAFDSPRSPFFKDNLPGHLRHAYLYGFLLVLVQRFALIRLSEHVSAIGDRRNRRTERLLQVRAEMHRLTASLYFAQAFHSDHHHRFYQLLQTRFGVKELFEEVDHEIRELHDVQQALNADRLQHNLGIAAAIVGPASVISGLLGANWKDFEGPRGAYLLALLAAITVLGIAVILHSVRSRE